MKPIKFTFALHLEDRSVEKYERPNGPLFSRWLPNGVEDAVSLLIENNSDDLRVWFKRRGKVVSDFIQYDRKFEDVPIDTMVRQGKLDAGPLFGEYITSHYTEKELEAAISESTNDDKYILFGKRVVSAISEPVSNFLNLLRFRYGQYWLSAFRPWDSREMSLGAYCSNIYLRVFVDDKGDGIKIVPTDPVHRFTVTMGGKEYDEYLSESDWREIQSIGDNLPGASLATRIFGSVSRLIDSQMLRQAFFEATTSFELALTEYRKNVISSLDVKDEYLGQLANLSLGAQLLAIAPALPELISCRVNEAVRAIEIRNQIAHEGYHPIEKDEKCLRTLSEVIGYLLGQPVIKLPSLSIGNSLSPPKNSESDDQ